MKFTFNFLFVLVYLPALEAFAIDSYLDDRSFWHLLFLCLTTSLYIVGLANEIVSWTSHPSRRAQ